jgi:amidase
MSTVTPTPTVVEHAELIRSGEASAVELVERALRAIDSRNGQIGAFVALCAERALAEAARILPGDPRPLAGVPFGVKDLFAGTEGVPTTHGSAAFGDWIADADAPHVARLRAAGAILIGRTNTCELGLRPVTEPQRYGPARNPRHPELMAGGSSGGSAAAVAGELVPFCDGSDSGGSIRIPSACCGVVGMRPSRGLVPNSAEIDAIGLSIVTTYGPIARTVRDAATVLDVMAGSDHLAALAPPGRLPVRLALTAPLGVPVDDEPRAAAVLAARALADLGHDVTEATPDWDDEGFPGAWMTAGAGSFRALVGLLERLHGRPMDPDALEPETRALLVDMPPIPDAIVRDAEHRLEAYGRRLVAGWPDDGIVITPTLARLPAPLHSLAPGTGVSEDAVRFSTFLRVFNVSGQPAITIPAGDTVGVQIVGAPGRDDLVLAVAAQLEEALR